MDISSRYIPSSNHNLKLAPPLTSIVGICNTDRATEEHALDLGGRCERAGGAVWVLQRVTLVVDVERLASRDSVTLISTFQRVVRLHQGETHVRVGITACCEILESLNVAVGDRCFQCRLREQGRGQE